MIYRYRYLRGHLRGQSFVSVGFFPCHLLAHPPVHPSTRLSLPSIAGCLRSVSDMMKSRAASLQVILKESKKESADVETPSGQDGYTARTRAKGPRDVWSRIGFEVGGNIRTHKTSFAEKRSPRSGRRFHARRVPTQSHARSHAEQRCLPFSSRNKQWQLLRSKASAIFRSAFGSKLSLGVLPMG